MGNKKLYFCYVEFIKELLFNIGTHIDPKKLIKVNFIKVILLDHGKNFLFLSTLMFSNCHIFIICKKITSSKVCVSNVF